MNVKFTNQMCLLLDSAQEDNEDEGEENNPADAVNAGKMLGKMLARNDIRSILDLLFPLCCITKTSTKYAESPIWPKMCPRCLHCVYMYPRYPWCPQVAHGSCGVPK